MAKQREGNRGKRRSKMRIEVFCREVIIDGNQARAARVAGAAPASARQQGHVLMQDPDVVARLAELKAAALQRQDKQLDDVLEELTCVGFSRVRDVATVVKGKLIVRDLDDIPERAQAAIAEMTQVEGGVRVKLHPKVPALIALGKHHGLKDTTRHEHTGPDGAPIASSGSVTFYLPDNGRRPPAPEPSSPPAAEPAAKG
jgi:phage terminase small subunit